MSRSSHSLSAIEQSVIRLRVALTVIKVRVQMTARRTWGMNGTEQDEHNARLATINESVNRAVDELTHLQELVESLADGASPTQR
jgi:Mg2+ and Co2+ transporter CorA